MKAATDFRTFEKKTLRDLLYSDKLERLQEQLREITTSDAHKDLADEVALISGRLSEYQKTFTIGTGSEEELRILRNKLRLSFLNIITALPDEMTVAADPSVKPMRLMTEQKFKSWIFGIMLAGKLLTMVFIVFQMDTGGFTQEQGLSVIFLILPALTAYVGAMLADIIRRRNDLFPADNDRKPVSKTMQRATFIILPLYFLFLFVMISRYAVGYMTQNGDEADFKTLTTSLGMVESGFGIYVGQIVYGLFREK